MIKKLNTKRRLVIAFIILILSSIPVYSITDSDYSNNKKSVNIDVFETFSLDAIFFPIEDIPPDDYTSSVTNLVNYLEDVYPIADNSFNSTVSTLAKFVNKLGILTSNDTANLTREIEVSAWLSGHQYGAGIAADEWFLDRLSKPTVTGFTYANAAVIVREGQYKTLAHEIGHTSPFELCDEYNETVWTSQNNDGTACPNAKNQSSTQLNLTCKNANGCPTQTLPQVFQNWGSIDSNHQLRNLMGGTDKPNQIDSGDNGIPFNSWISKESYDALFDKLKQPVNSAVSSCLLSSIEIQNDSGVISYSMKQFYKVTSPICKFSESSNTSASKQFEVRIQNSTNTTFINSYDYSFNLLDEGSGDVIILNTTFFSLILPFSGNDSIIKVEEDSVIKTQRVATPNVPIVSLVSPVSGQKFFNPFLVNWSASDADGDSMKYAVLVSQDGGYNYTTWAIDVNDTNVTIDNKYFQNSSISKVKVLATDGVNTNFSVTGTFTLVPASIRVVNITDLKVNSTTNKVFEILVENDGNTVLNNISWAFTNGETTYVTTNNITSRLNMSDTLKVYVEYNYTDATNRIVTFNASEGTFNVSDKASLTIV